MKKKIIIIVALFVLAFVSYEVYQLIVPFMPKLIFEYTIEDETIQILKVTPGALGEDKLLIMVNDERVSMIADRFNSLRKITINENYISIETSDTSIKYNYRSLNNIHIVN